MKLTAKQLAEAFVNLTESAEGKDLNAAAKAFVTLLAERNELYRTRDVVDAIDSVWKERYGAASITITSAHPLNKEAIEILVKLANGAEIKEEVSPELIGGARIRIDDRIIDGSIAGHLANLKQHLSEAT